MQGIRVKELLSALNLSQTDFSKEFGIGVSTLNEVIRGKTKGLSPEILEKLYARYNFNRDGSIKEEPHHHLLNSLVVHGKEKSYDLILDFDDKTIGLSINEDGFIFLFNDN